MSAYARIFLDNHNIRVRFEQAGNRSRFDIVLDSFRAAFPLATWDEQYRAWRIPQSQLGDLLSFCQRLFGSANVKIQLYDTTDFRLCQLTFL